jgi:hypothetical protein
MKRLITSLLLLALCGGLLSAAEDAKEAQKDKGAKTKAKASSTEKSNADQHVEKPKKQKTKQKRLHAKHSKKGPPSASGVPTKPETIRADPYSKAPETKTLPPTIR